MAIDTPFCLNCRAIFSPANVHSAAGWAEVKISGLCEECFDMICAEGEEPEFTEADKFAIHTDQLMREVSALKIRIENHRDRMKYYNDPVSIEDLEFLIAEFKRIEESFK